jgi:xanthine dehydrogenase accessory factor
MQYLDQQVIEQALAWLHGGEPVWLCTVLSTFGSSPREPGSMMVARFSQKTQQVEHLGSLSGGCVEEDFFERLSAGKFSRPAEILRYGAGATTATDGSATTSSKIQLPCGGSLDVLIEKWQPAEAARQHAQAILNCLSGRDQSIREVSITDGHNQLIPSSSTTANSPHCITPRHSQTGRVERFNNRVRIQIGPACRLIIAGLSSVAPICAEFAVALGYEVIVCEPRPEERQGFALPGVTLDTRMPSVFISQTGNCHTATAIVAMTHDPRIDDLTMMNAVKTPAFYIGVMGSRKTSDARAARLMRSGGLTAEEVERIHMPIGLALGSKTPAEIALAIMADVVRVQKGQSRDQL